jgi:LPS sulfotransferase NodH
MANMYRRHLSSVEAWLAAQEHIDTLYINYAQLLDDPTAQIQRLHTFLGLPLDVQAMQVVPDKRLYRNRGKKNREGR